MDDFEAELKQDFLEESVDLLSDAESAFLDLESERDNPELLNRIFRLAHNLKGTSKAVGFDQLAEVTHIAENLILKLKEGQLEVTDNVVTVLLEFKDKITEMVDGLKDDFDIKFDVADILKKLEETTNGTGATEDSEISETVENDPIPDASAFGEEEDQKEDINTLQSELRPQSSLLESLRADGFDEDVVNKLEADMANNSDEEEIVEVKKETADFDPQSALLESLRADGFDEDVVNKLEADMKAEASASTPEEKVEDVIPAPKKEVTADKKTKTKAKEGDESIRVSLSKIDKINNIVGELVILQTVLNQRRFEFITDDLSNKSISMMGKLFKEAQELSMSLRMLPLKSTFQKMTRTVRDTANALDKKVQLHLVGEETEVDKTVLEKLADPLVHIIRNAVDHGLEANADRAMNGKSEVGNVELMAYHEGSNLVIQVTDDGKGIDPDIIRKKAIEKGVLKEHSTMSDQQVIQLIFHPGFSTKEQVTEVSGRGVGMDVVKTNIEGLGGEVNLMSKLGEGSSFRIVLPLTLAIIEGIIIKAHEEKFVLPLSQIFEISQVKAEDVESFSGVASLFKLRGEVLPLFHINKKLGKNIDKDAPAHTVVVVRGLDHAFGVVVDDILNQQQIVIKKLGEDIQNQKGIIGSAIMADGMPSLILDLFELFRDDIKKSRGHQNYKERNTRVA